MTSLRGDTAMTFAAQRRLAAAIGLTASALVGLLALLAAGLAPEKGSNVDSLFAVMLLTLLGVAALALVFGVVMRSLQRWFWFAGKIGESPLFRRRILTGWASGFWRWWLHIDENGDDLDRR